MTSDPEETGTPSPESGADDAAGELEATPQLIDRLHSAGVLSSKARVDALAIVNGPLAWWPWVEKALLFLGLALTLSGVVCFFAWNWDAMPGLVKLAIVQAGIVACCVAAYQKKIATLPGKAAITAAAVLVGVFLAVFGQVYQTGADAYQLFVGWALLILPWVVMCRLAGLWVLWLAIVNVAVSLFWGQAIHPRGFDEAWLPLILGLLNGLVAVTREVVTERGCNWLPIWFRRLAVAASLVMFGIPSFAIIADIGRADIVAWIGVLGLLTGLALIYWQFRRRSPDLCVLTCGATTITVLACAGVIRVLMDVGVAALAFFGSGLAILGIVAVMTRWLMLVARDLREHSPESLKDSGVNDDLLSIASEPATHRIPMRELLGELSTNGQLTEHDVDAAMAIATTPEERAPWFVQALIGFGAWLSCILFLGALAIAGLFDEEAASIVVGVLLLAAGAALDRFTEGSFLRQLGLAAGLTGFGLVGVGAVGMNARSEFLALTFSFSAATLVFYGVFRSESFRFLSCLSTAGIAACWAFGESSRRYGNPDGFGWALHTLVLIETLGVGLVFSKFQRKWLQPAGYAMTVGLLGTLLATLLPHTPQAWPSAIILALALVGIIRQAWTADSAHWKGGLGVTVAGTALLAALSVPGILAAVGATLLGHLERDAVLKRLGVIILPIYIIAYYYNLDTPLLLKSLALIGSGLILWAARYYFRRHVRNSGSTSAETQS